ncbi:MAG: hypothetical protein HRT61_01030 [Ekhidna sp.]|nr:hypothetical protein [Ekhidna sp.]
MNWYTREMNELTRQRNAGEISDDEFDQAVDLLNEEHYETLRDHREKLT